MRAFRIPFGFVSEWTIRVAAPLGRLVLGVVRCAILTGLVVGSSLLVRWVRIALLPAQERTRWRFGIWYLHHFCRAAARLLGLRVEVRGPLPDPGALVVSNHRSYLDIIALGSVFRTFFVAKAEVASWPLVGPGGQAIGIPFVRREDPTSRKATIHEVIVRLQAGFPVVNFPEGTTYSSDRPGPFRPGLFCHVVGQPFSIQPVTVRYDDSSGDWVGKMTFLDHLFRMAMRPRTRIEVVFSSPLNAASFSDPEALRAASWQAVANPLPPAPRTTDLPGWLRRPWLRQARFLLKDGVHEIVVYDQPGRWMTDAEIASLRAELVQVAQGAMDEVPTYGVFRPGREALSNRVVGVCRDRNSAEPVAFTAMVYLRVRDPWRQGRQCMVVHLGLTMIRKDRRGRRLQTPLFRKVFLLPILNQFRLGFLVTNIAASPAGIGATSDYFRDVYPHYRGTTRLQSWHLDIATEVLARYRHEFGTSSEAVFDPETFVVRGSNDASGGGAYQFIREDPVSRYRVEECNTFVRSRLDFARGDEQFQVGRVDLLTGTWASRSSRRRPRVGQEPSRTMRAARRKGVSHREAA